MSLSFNSTSQLGHFIPANLYLKRVENSICFDVKYSLLKIGDTEYGMWICL
jgi:hypothetical protein